MSWTHRRWTWPSYLAVAAWVIATAGYLAGDGAWRIIVVITIALTGVWTVWRWQQRALRTTHTARVLAAMVGVGSWTTIATAAGPWTAPWVGFWLVGAVWAQIAWTTAIRKAAATREKKASDTAADEAETPAAVWERDLACPGGAFPKSVLTDVTPRADGGWSGTVTLDVVGDQDGMTVARSTGRIGKVFTIPRDLVTVSDAMASGGTARVHILGENPLRQVITYKGATLDPATGMIRLGIHKDGTPAKWQLWRPGSGVCHGLVAGTTDAGKSGVQQQLCTEILQSDRALLALADPQGGTSVVDFALGADMFAGTPDRIRWMLQGIERFMHEREQEHLRTVRRDKFGRVRFSEGTFDPTPDNPALYLILEEAAAILKDDECRRIVAKIGKMGRKLGVGAILFTQVPSLAELGNDLALRAMIASMNVLILRTSDQYSERMGSPVPLPFSPSTIPAQWPDGSSTAGIGLSATVGGAVCELRCHKVEDQFEWGIGAPARLWGDPAIRDLDDRALSEWAYETPHRIRVSPGLTPRQIAAWDHPEKDLNLWRDWKTMLFTPDDDAGTATPVTAEESTADRILALLAEKDRAVTNGVVRQVVGLSPSGTSTALARLAKRGLVEDLGRGRWCITDAGREEIGVTV